MDNSLFDDLFERLWQRLPRWQILGISALMKSQLIEIDSPPRTLRPLSFLSCFLCEFCDLRGKNLTFVKKRSDFFFQFFASGYRVRRSSDGGDNSDGPRTSPKYGVDIVFVYAPDSNVANTCIC